MNSDGRGDRGLSFGLDVRTLLKAAVLEAAPQLLGCRVATTFEGHTTQVMLTEVEAYAGEQDAASHAYRGRTPRNRSMFEAAGTLYVYRSYGLHWCMNIVIGPPDVPHAVLLRGGLVEVGEQTIAHRRQRLDHLTDGPGKLCQALGVSGAHDGTSSLTGPIHLTAGRLPSDFTISTTPRIGISKAASKPWRWLATPGDTKG